MNSQLFYLCLCHRVHSGFQKIDGCVCSENPQSRFQRFATHRESIGVSGIFKQKRVIGGDSLMLFPQGIHAHKIVPFWEKKLKGDRH